MTSKGHDARVIVVGVDGSPGSLRAMQWAVGEAELRGCAIEAVTVWRPGSPGPDSHRAAEQLQEHLVRQACANAATEPLISEEIEMGAPEQVLVARSRRACLLAVGSHGVGSIRHAVLGSTSEYCSRMAACPVVVLPMPVDATEEAIIDERQALAEPSAVDAGPATMS